MMDSTQAHWDKAYGSRAVTEVSWYEARPEKSLELIRATGVKPTAAIVDVGAGGSVLVDELLEAGFRDVTVLDISAEALRKLRARLGVRTSLVTLLHEDVTAFQPTRPYAVWHDRAVFHFMVERAERKRYINALCRALLPNGHLIIATFGPSGPERCSGLPVMRYSAPALAAELGSGFTLVDSSLAMHRTPKGVEQQFLYSRFARKQVHV